MLLPKELGIGTLFGVVRDAVVVASAEAQRIILWNEAATDVFGYSTFEALELRVEDLVPERLRDQHRAGITRYGETGHGPYIDSRRALELPALRKGGEEIYVELSLSPIGPVDGTDDHEQLVLAIIRDITERKRAEEEVRRLNQDLKRLVAERTAQLEATVAQLREKEKMLRRSEERFRALVQHTSDVVTVLKADGTVMYSSPSAERVLGYRPEELLGTNAFDHVQPGDAEVAPSALAQSLCAPRDGSPVLLRARHADGSWRYLEAVGSNLLDHPHVGGIVVNWRDVTERKRAEEELRETSTLFMTLTESMQDGILVEDGSRRVLHANGKFCAMFGVPAPPSALVGADCPEAAEELKGLFAKPRSFVRRIDETIKERRVVASEELPLADGRTFERDYVPILMGGDHVGHMWQYRDATERKRAEEEMQEAKRRLEDLATLRADFTAMVVHELYSPLAVIRMLTEVLAASEFHPATRATTLDGIRTELDSLNTLVADVQQAAAVERDDFTVQPQRITVGELLARAAAFAETLPGDHPLAVRTEAHEQVWADPDRIGQVLRNLLSNAAKYSPDGTPIELRAEPGQAPGRVRIEVADHGYGVHPEDTSRVLEKFGRGRDRSGRKVAGVGLGLYLSQRIVRAHGSELTLSSNPGTGSVFGFELRTVR